MFFPSQKPLKPLKIEDFQPFQQFLSYPFRQYSFPGYQGDEKGKMISYIIQLIDFKRTISTRSFVFLLHLLISHAFHFYFRNLGTHDILKASAFLMHAFKISTRVLRCFSIKNKTLVEQLQ